MRSLLLGGIFPVVAFTLVEEYYGTVWGLVAGMVFGVGEILWEAIARRHVDIVTWIGNGILIVLGLISLFTNEGIWFKLQPSLIEAATAALMGGSVALGKPFLTLMARKQGVLGNLPPEVRPGMERFLRGFTLRVGLFFLLHAALATWAALYWSTRAWAILKGVGLTGTLILYMLGETYVMRKRMAKEREAVLEREAMRAAMERARAGAVRPPPPDSPFFVR